MKTIFIAIALILGISVYAQVKNEKKDVFVRVFDLQGKKIGKGKILSITDSSIELKGKSESPISVANIGLIKTKHSGGHNVLIGAASGATLFGIIGLATADTDDNNDFFALTSGEQATGGAIVGGVAGAAVGGITILFKDSKSHVINGDELKLKEFKEALIGID